MSARALIARICSAITFSDANGWGHNDFGQVAGKNDLRRLTRFIYEYYYLGLPKDRVKLPADVRQFRSLASYENRRLADKHRKAVPHSYYESYGWRLLGNRDGKMIVKRDGVCLSLEGGQMKDGGDDETVTVLMPTERPYASAGFFTAFSDLGPPTPGEKVDRLYVNVGADDADKIFGLVLDWASGQGLNAIAKVANHVAAFDRCDTFVAYFPRSRFRPRRSVLIERILSGNYAVRPATPAFTSCLGDGLAWAEDPASDGLGHVGFGMHRCGIIAQALEFAEKNEPGSPGELEKEVLDCLKKAGLDVDSPHLSPPAW